MRHSTEPKYRKHIEGYGLLSFSRIVGDKYCKKLMNTATKTEIDAAKATSERAVQKIAETAGDLIGNKIADKITLAGKTKSTQREDETNKSKKFTYHQKKGRK